MRQINYKDWSLLLNRASKQATAYNYVNIYESNDDDIVKYGFYM
jgi:hypothetical protein